MKTFKKKNIYIYIYLNVRSGGLTRRKMEGIHTTTVSMKNLWFIWWNSQCVHRNCRTVTTHFVTWKSNTHKDFSDQRDIKQYWLTYESPTFRPKWAV